VAAPWSRAGRWRSWWHRCRTSLYPWCRQVAAKLTATVEAHAARIEQAYADLVGQVPVGFSRKELAALGVTHPLRWALFLRLDGKDLRRKLWERAEPEAFWTPSGRTYGEDTT
jgi:RNA ligase